MRFGGRQVGDRVVNSSKAITSAACSPAENAYALAERMTVTDAIPKPARKRKIFKAATGAR
jgi:hypothetical protein